MMYVHTGYKSCFEFEIFGRKMWVYSDLFSYEDIKRTHEDINKTPIHEIMGQKH